MEVLSLTHVLSKSLVLLVRVRVVQWVRGKPAKGGKSARRGGRLRLSFAQKGDIQTDAILLWNDYRTLTSCKMRSCDASLASRLICFERLPCTRAPSTSKATSMGCDVHSNKANMICKKYHNLDTKAAGCCTAETSSLHLSSLF